MVTLECARVVKVILHLTDRSLPAPPFDLVMARAEWYTFRDKSGILVTHLKQHPSHYHIHLDCARAIESNFVPLALMCLHIFYQNLLSFTMITSDWFVD